MTGKQELHSCSSEESDNCKQNKRFRYSVDIIEGENTVETYENSIDSLFITLIWYDSNLKESNSLFTDDITQTEGILRELSDFVYLCTNEVDCIRQIETAKNERVILIIAGICATKSLFQKVDLFRHVDTILIFCMDRNKYLPLVTNNETGKVIEIITDHKSLKQYIANTVRDIENQLAVISHYSPSKQKSIKNLHNASGSFVWVQLIKGIMKKLSHSKDFENFDAKKEMLCRLRQYYRNNLKVLKRVNNFEKEYAPDKALNWYTKNCFLFRMINRALRTENIEELLTYAFYITDLSSCLKEHCEFFRENSMVQTFEVYRGTRLSMEEIEYLQKSIGQLIAVNCFFSTSRNEKVAKMFAGTEEINMTSRPVLFKIEVNINDEQVIFADLQSYSDIKDEEEILFDFASVFEIKSIAYDTDAKIWICFMKTSNVVLAKVKEYLQMKQVLISNNSEVILLGNLFYEMNKFHMSKIYFEKLKTRMPDNVHVLFGLGRANCALHVEYDLALKYLEMALTICVNQHPLNSVDFAMINIYIARVHDSQGRYILAMETLTNAIWQLERTSMTETVYYAKVLRFIGSVQINLGDDETSLQSFQKTLEITKRLTPEDYPQLSLVHINIAFSLYHMGKYDESLEFASLALDIAKPVLPDISTHMALIFNHIGKNLYKKLKYEQALDCHTRSLEIYKQMYPDGKSSHFAVCYNNLGKVLCRTQKYAEATEYFNKALCILEVQNTGNIKVADTLKNQAQLHLVQNDFQKSIHYINDASK